jgi:hypothetical protein
MEFTMNANYGSSYKLNLKTQFLPAASTFAGSPKKHRPILVEHETQKRNAKPVQRCLEVSRQRTLVREYQISAALLVGSMDHQLSDTCVDGAAIDRRLHFEDLDQSLPIVDAEIDQNVLSKATAARQTTFLTPILERINYVAMARNVVDNA